MTWHAHFDAFSRLLPGVPSDTYPEGLPFRLAMAHGTMTAELFSPVGTDRQQPHAQDELYVVVRGTSEFLRADEWIEVAAGDVLFVPAGMEHRFESFSEDFSTWVIFWGPVGGEAAVDPAPGSGATAVPAPPQFPRPVVAPAGLRHDAFVLEPLGPRHNERDHAAWSSSIDHIRATPGFVPEAWGGDTWPYPMPLDANLADLEQHAAEFAAAEAFAYTVLDPADGDVIGCVYVDPDETGTADAQCRCWVRADRAGLDPLLFETVRSWLLGPVWPFARVRFPGRSPEPLTTG